MTILISDRVSSDRPMIFFSGGGRRVGGWERFIFLSFFGLSVNRLFTPQN